MDKFKYLVYDIESVTNKTLLNKVLYASSGYSDEEAYLAHLKELEKNERIFVNIAFHKPVALAAVAVQDDFSISKIGLLGGEKRNSQSIVTQFWDIYNNQRPVFVDFNGKGYDMRLMELWAFQLGIAICGNHFKKFGNRYRYSEEAHIDVQEFLSNFGAARFQGGLNLFSKLLGKPGKMETKGEMVQPLYDEGRMADIEDYCLSDAMDTYFVFLRTRVMTGELSLEREKKLVDQAKIAIETKLKEEGFFKNYLQNFGEWVPFE